MAHKLTNSEERQIKLNLLDELETHLSTRLANRIKKPDPLKQLANAVPEAEAKMPAVKDGEIVDDNTMEARLTKVLGKKRSK